MNESEKVTRKRRINTKLKANQLKWNIIPWTEGMDISSLNTCVEELKEKMDFLTCPTSRLTRREWDE